MNKLKAKINAVKVSYRRFNRIKYKLVQNIYILYYYILFKMSKTKLTDFDKYMIEKALEWRRNGEFLDLEEAKLV